MIDSLLQKARAIYHRVPQARRQQVRRVLGELPIRLRDAPFDLRDRFADRPLPPPRLRALVGINSSRRHFLDIGRGVAADIERLLGVTPENPHFRRWLDFGCGAGRVARHLVQSSPLRMLTGVDTDTEAIRWSAKHLAGDFHSISPKPPLPMPEASFDVIYAISVFTHFSETQQNVWLRELGRVLRPGGLLLATTSGPELTYNRPDLTESDHLTLQSYGFVFRKGNGSFNDDSAFHTYEYLSATWAKEFELVAFHQSGLVGYLDVSIWRRP